ncbi:hypothetical protein F66182_13716, partial [Fusarium sp. NRRL 66182]
MTIKPWNDCLVKGQSVWDDCFNQGQLGPVPLRIITYGAEWENELPEWALAFRVPTAARIKMLRDVPENLDKKLPPPDSDLWKRAQEYLELPENSSNTPVAAPDDWMEGDFKPWYNIEQKFKRLLRFKHPEPGTAFTYEEWKTNRHNDKAIIDIVRHRIDWHPIHRPFNPVTPPHTPYTISLQDSFRKQGLQIIVKIENIELTPQNPTYTNDSWQLDGQLNEHIAAVAVFAYDVLNITSPKISFRQNTALASVFYQIAEEKYTTGDYSMVNCRAHRCGKSYPEELWAIGRILGFENPWHLTSDHHDMLSYQDIGSVSTLPGRLITFPSVLEYRVDLFQLLDTTIPGHYRSIKMYLIDPHYRICSTRNVPPQQHHWWTQEVGKELSSAGLPAELVDEISRRTDDWPMGMEEARQHRHNLNREHIWNEMSRFS